MTKAEGWEDGFWEEVIFGQREDKKGLLHPNMYYIIIELPPFIGEFSVFSKVFCLAYYLT